MPLFAVNPSMGESQSVGTLSQFGLLPPPPPPLPLLVSPPHLARQSAKPYVGDGRGGLLGPDTARSMRVSNGSSISMDNGSSDGSSDDPSASSPPFKGEVHTSGGSGLHQGRQMAAASLTGVHRPTLSRLSGTIDGTSVVAEESRSCDTSSDGVECAKSPTEGDTYKQGIDGEGMLTEADAVGEHMGRLSHGSTTFSVDDESKQPSDWGEFVG